VIDAHVHIWRLGRNGCTWPPPDLTAIHRDHDLTDVVRTTAGTGVEHVVLVQSQESEDDTAWLLAEAAASPVAAGVVGWIDPAAIDVRARVERFQRQGPLVGLRVMAQDRPPEWLAAPTLHDMMRHLDEAELTLDLLIRPQHLPASIALAARFPALRMIIDHCAKPGIASHGLDAWREAIAPAAELPNMMCKLSGLITEAARNWQPSDFERYLDHVFACFGPEVERAYREAGVPVSP